MSSTNSDAGFSRETSPTVSRHPCVTCQRRKVRCDRKTPCTRCFKSGQECRQPEIFRAPRRPRRTQEANVLDRVRLLEDSLEQMRSLVSIAPPEKEPRRESLVRRDGSVSVEQVAIKPEPLEDTLGRLIIDEERSRYVSGSAWQNLADQVGDLRTLLEEDVTNDEESPNSAQYLTQGIFPSNAAMKITYSQTGLKFLWERYAHYCDPVMKTIHVPSMEPVVEGVLSNIRPPSKVTEALLSAIKFAAVTSMCDEDCWANFSTSREILLDMFKSEVQSTLNAANFLSVHDIGTLQAFVIFLFCNRRREQPSAMWISCGIAIRLAQSIGLHRDGAAMHLPILATEIRRRLFFEIRMLDLGCAEDCGFLPTHIYGADIRLPTHCNDDDIHPGMTTPPKEREGFTDMTFVMTRYEMTYRLHAYVPHPSGQTSMGILTGTSSEFPSHSRAVSDFHTIVQQKYLSSCNPAIPFQSLTLKIGAFILSKMSLISQYPKFQGSNRASQISEALKEELFNTSCHLLEITDELFSDPETKGWSWMMQTYVHWHPVAYILNELCVNPRHPQVVRAWAAIDMAYANLHGLTYEANLALWKPLKGLLNRAKMARQKAGLDVEAQYLTPATVPTVSPFPVSISAVGQFAMGHEAREVQEQTFLPEQNLVPADESLMTFDLTTPFATMADFMTGVPENYGVEGNWWMGGNMVIAGDMNP